ncbi:MAG TPA: GNAT family N-acetyltransferase [Thermoanaerobaculia bacterium]|jgi:ribosomal-protein-alanine N-acetyltransferase|nr:GNAT family N-acetyltransferase [Thermoanaerobaculia bacterium]
MPRPTLTTRRLVLRPFDIEDAPAVQSLAGDREIARNTLLIPHPYPEGAADEWIKGHDDKSDNHIFAITAGDGGEVMGAIGLHVERNHDRAEIGYWLGVPYWGNGYVTEAARAVVGYAFDDVGVHRVFAFHFTRNPASGKVLQKIGMRREGTMRQHLVKWGEHVDIDCYGIVRDEWVANG